MAYKIQRKSDGRLFAGTTHNRQWRVKGGKPYKTRENAQATADEIAHGARYPGGPGPEPCVVVEEA